MAKRKSDPTDEVLETVDAGRRQALKKMISGAAFIVPAIASLPLACVGAEGGPSTPGTPPPWTLGPVPTRRPTPRPHS